MLIDAHAHLDDEAFDGDRESVMKKIREKGMIVINAGSNIETSKFSVELSQKHDFIYACVGIHPHEAAKAGQNYLETLKQLAEYERVLAIGEIGLDYHYDFCDREIQKKVFAEQLELAKELGLPVVVHDREAHRDTLEILQKSGVKKGLMHCYSASLEMAEEFMKIGFYFSFGGTITFKNASRPKQAASKLPLDKILLETDCPYLSPEPRRGKRNDPTEIETIASALAKLRGVSIEEIERATASNVRNLFGRLTLTGGRNR
ncbi:MAG: TatD family hydrolase [Tepidanaerobacteraceae bacterium]|nr:TatD family hydrolase [Tepidanaerobacteraceae bacterium]